MTNPGVGPYGSNLEVLVPLIPHGLSHSCLQRNGKVVPIAGGMRFHHDYKGRACLFFFFSVDPTLNGQSKRQLVDSIS